MIKKILLLLTLLTFNVSALDLFKAKYTVYKDGEKIGKSSIELTKDETNYVITDRTNGTHGMASFLGFQRTERTIFTENNGLFSPGSYQLKQKVAFNKRNSNYQVDEDSQKISGTYKGDDWQLDKQQPFLTPNLVSLKLFIDVCAGESETLNYDVLKKGRLNSYQFKVTSREKNIIEVDKIHNKTTRTTKMWLDTNQHCLPIRTYHIEDGEESLETRLINFTLHS
jgi:hypothetical protein